MKQIIINKNEKDNKLIVNVKLPERKYARDPIQQFSNSELLEYLKEEGVSLSDYQIEDQPKHGLTSYSTKGLLPNLEGTWIFAKVVKKEEKVNKSNSQPYKKKRVKKSGD